MCIKLHSRSVRFDVFFILICPCSFPISCTVRKAIFLFVGIEIGIEIGDIVLDDDDVIGDDTGRVVIDSKVLGTTVIVGDTEDDEEEEDD